MKHLIIPVVLLTFTASLPAQNTEVNLCTITAHHGNYTKKFEAYGDVYVLTDKDKERADLDVKMDASEKLATYRIFRCTDTPKKCGEWRFVSDKKKAKFTIRFVKTWEDCTIYYVDDRKKAGFFR